MKQYPMEFLKQLDRQKNRIIYARLTALTLDELPLQQIEGYITQGSINVDGASSVRRTCSFSIVAREENFKFSNYEWSFNTKFKLEIGIENNINVNYPNIIWFQQGIFILTSFNVSRNANSITINLQGKDKMCLLNGEIGGNLESEVNFGQIKETDKNNHTFIKKIPLKEIIKNILIQYGREQEHNIIINDLDDYGLELLEYRGVKPLYLFRQVDGTKIDGIETAKTGSSDVFLTATYQGDTICQVRPPNFIPANSEEAHSQPMFLKNLENNDWYTTYDTISEGLLGKSNNIAEVWFDSSENNYEAIKNTYNVIKIQYGQTVGFRTTELVFAGDLTAKVGESLTSVLDKIKNMLGEYEYFYDINGKFIFQQKPSAYRRNWLSAMSLTDINTNLQSNINMAYMEKLEKQRAYIYPLGNTELITAFNNTPVINNLKNDFAIWGSAPSPSGGNISIYLRYAIDEKPQKYRIIKVDNDNNDLINYKNKYNLNITGQNSVVFVAGNTPKIEKIKDEIVITCDWRELIFRMANDFFKYGFLPNFKQLVNQANDWCINGITGYEQYYTDIQQYWRFLYNINYLEFQNNTLYDIIYKDQYTIKDYQSYENTKEGINYPSKNYYLPDINKNFNINTHYNYWNKAVIEAPETLNFWFDLNNAGKLNDYSVKSIGRRTKVINDTNIKAMFYEDTPTVIFVDNLKDYIKLSSGDYSYIQIPDETNMFSISSQGQSAMDKLNTLIQQHTYCTENVSITVLPIYHLQPNTRIYIEDNALGVNGEYVVSKFTIQLSHQGTMTITATKTNDNITY